MTSFSKLFLFCSFFAFAGQAFSAELDDRLNRDVDKAHNSKSFRKGQFLAVPIPMSNPTIGSGLQAALLYMHPSKKNSADSPNATSGLGGMYTDTDSWVAGLFHDNYLFDDRLRVRGVVGTGDVNVNFYGSGSDPAFADDPVQYNLTANVALIQALGRLPGTKDWFGGLKVVVMESTITFDLDALIPGIPVLDDDMKIANMAVVVNYDNRDNNYYPRTGRFLNMEVGRDDESLGSDYSFDRYTLSYNHYFSASEKSVIAVRGYSSMVDGEAPFFLMPTLNMRGFSSGRYQDEAAVSGHLEWRHKFHPRWGFMLSAEVGSVGNSISNALDNKVVTSTGAGIRWQVSKKQAMHLGLDVGVSEDGEAIYLHVGEKF